MIKDFTRHDGEAYVSVNVAADMCGVTRMTYDNWRRIENPPPYDEHKKQVPVRALGEWIRQEQVLKRGKGGKGFPYLPDIDRIYDSQRMPGIPATEAPEARLKRLQADKIEIELLQTKGELIPVDQAKDAWMLIVQRVKTKLLRLPTALAPLVLDETDQYAIQGKLTDGVNEALEELVADWDE